MAELVQITETEYKQLQADSKFLNALEACGVDNWEGYSEAYRMAFPEEADY